MSHPMLLHLRLLFVLIATAVVTLSGSSASAAIVFSNDFKADFRFTVVDGPLVPALGLGTVLDFDARGPLTFTLDDSVPNATTMNFTNVTGTLTVVGPAGFAGSTISPNLQFVGGQLTSIVRNGGVITSGNVTDLRMRWEMFSGATRLYTKDSIAFNGTISSVPFTSSDFLAEPANFDVFLDAGLGAADPLAIVGSNRVLTVVPEPSSLALLAMAGLGCSWVRRRKNKA